MTELVNNLWMHARKRLRTVINAEIKPYFEADKKLLSSRSYIQKKLFRDIVGATMKTNIEEYKNKDDIKLYADEVLQSVKIKDMIIEHKAWLYNAFVDPKTLPHYIDGVLSEFNVQKRPHLYLAYQLFLAQRMDTINTALTKGDPSIRQKATFQIIPQLTMKRRYVTFGKEQTVDLLYFLAKRDQAGDFINEEQVLSKVVAKVDKKNKKQETTTEPKARKRKETDVEDRKHSKKQKLDPSSPWQSRLSRDMIKSLWSKTLGLFNCPRGIQKHWNGVVTTDGIVASWHTEKESVTDEKMTKEEKTKEKKTKEKKIKKESSSTTIITHLENKLYGTHGPDVLFKIKEPFNIIAVDPGHAELIHSVRLHQTDQARRLLLPECAKDSSKRYLAKHRFLTAENKSTFKLTNKQWNHDTGRLTLREKTQVLHHSLSLHKSINILASATSKTTSEEAYFLHVTARLQTAPDFMKLMRVKCTSRWKFETYQKEQRSIQKLANDLLGGMFRTDTIVVWGNGGFGPTSKGHDSAPNKRLRKLLSRYLPIVTGTEYNTSKLSCCCHVESVKLKTKTYKKRGTVVKCGKCSNLLGRDENAAHNILHIFQHQFSHEGEVPTAFRPTNNKAFEASV
jgi:hypothetical protein